MPTDSEEDDSAAAESQPRRSRRAGQAVANYRDHDDDADDDDDEMEEDEEASHPSSSNNQDEEDLSDEEEEEESVLVRRPRRRADRSKSKKTAAVPVAAQSRRTSSRSTKFTGAMAEPSSNLRDLFQTNESVLIAGTGSSNKDDEDVAMKDSSDDEDERKPRARSSRTTRKVAAATSSPSSSSRRKSPARRHKAKRKSLDHHLQHDEDESSESEIESSESEDEDHDQEEEEEAPFKIQRILASRTETVATWKRICNNMNTSEITNGSRWFDDDDIDEETAAEKETTTTTTAAENGTTNKMDKDTAEKETTTNTAAENGTNPPADETKTTKDDKNDDDDVFEERFLVKWSDLSFLHVSWETDTDLVSQVENAKTYLTTFFRKSTAGYLYSPDERCDGDYFDPGFVQVERILEVLVPDNSDITADDDDDDTTAMNTTTNDDDVTNNNKINNYGMIFDKNRPDFDQGTGRQFLVKWSALPYSEASYEFERDLVVNEVDYVEKVAGFEKRNTKPTTTARKAYLKQGEEHYKELYTFFGDYTTSSSSKKSKMLLSESERDAAVEEYKQNLQQLVFKNGGQLRDYQAEGVAWMMANFVNQRSCCLADEMGLGKTLQTAAMANLLATKLNRGGPALIVAPLSTLSHWYREFTNWTDLNVIVYHGSAQDREIIREQEFAYECDRPENGSLGFNQLYLKACLPKTKRSKKGKSSSSSANAANTLLHSPWMVDVVVTTPEMMVTDDAAELAAVQWQLLVVDEAHRLKNHNSKLAICLRNDKFTFRHRMLLTGTPIQNDVHEFWTLLNFIDPGNFDDADDFMERYGDMKSKERVDEMHEEIRPYILRRLKEDVEHSVPPKEETLIEVELTVAQKQYYRALYEKNVKFLHKNKRKALDGPSLNNLAMQLRKCCNHLFLLNGVEEEFRRKEKAGHEMTEGDFLTKASGKLVLLDKLLPRLKEEGHRVLLFSQFKIMLDILEDYLNARSMKFERIDGSITGSKRQQAIDRYQTPSTQDREAPFIMMLSTRAGGVGINLTAADTCIIFDSDWNPQNDLQAQARCHRIGQTKSVKVYRLLTRKTYEMQMFHMSSLKMGLDQAVLKGFESGASGEGALSKEEVEKLLRHGAYDIFNEDKSGDGEAESNDFVQQDIDSILQRRSRTVVHDNTGSKSNAAGGTFSKASFKAKTPGSSSKNKSEDVDIEDPDFWKKMIGEGVVDDEEEDLGRRQRSKKNYSEHDYKRQLEAVLERSGGESDSDGSSSDEDEVDDDNHERFRWGGSLPNEWKKDDAESLVKGLTTYGYGRLPWDDFVKRLNLSKDYGIPEVKRMCWTAVLTSFLEIAEEDGEAAKKREVRAAEKAREETAQSKPDDGGVLAVDRTTEPQGKQNIVDLKRKAFEKLWGSASSWIRHALVDAVASASELTPRRKDHIDRALRKFHESPQPLKQSDTQTMFVSNVWPSLRSRGWKSEFITEGDSIGKTRYSYDGKEYLTHESVLQAALPLYPELKNVIEKILASAESNRQESEDTNDKERRSDLALSIENADMDRIHGFLQRYGSIQLVSDRVKASRIRLPRKILSNMPLLWNASTLVRRAKEEAGKEGSSIKTLASSLQMDKRTALPHPLWTEKHDSVLVHAIAKHGWIDHDVSVRAIAEDSTIKWGPPFEERQPGDALSVVQRHNSAQILQSAKRTVTFLNENTEFIEDLKGFNHQQVVRAYGLKRLQVGGEGSEQSGKRIPWALDPSMADNSGSDDALEAAELPPKKDLVRRAKAILSRPVSSADGKKNEATKPSYDFAVLDQRDVANALLAEFLRAMLKEPSQSKYNKRLCALASAEARFRADWLSSLCSSAVGKAEFGKAAEELRRIVDHLDQVRCNLTKSAVQYKNIVRVILGEEPQKPRKNDEGLFPPKRTFRTTLHTTVTSKSSSGKTAGPKLLTGKATGERAIECARKRLIERYSFKDGKSESDKDVSTLELTEIETLILATSCSFGIPVWTEDWRSNLHFSLDSSRPFRQTWGSFGKHIIRLAETEYDKARKAFTKADTEHDAHVKNGTARGSSRASLDFAQEKFHSKEDVLTQAKEYAADPETLAKKAIMLVSKIRQQLTVSMANPLTVRSDYGLGSKVLAWHTKETTQWAKALELLDNYGRPLAFTAVEFLHELPEEQRQSIEIASIFDKKGCRAVISQTALMTRLRSVFSHYDGAKLDSMIKQAANSLGGDEDTWERQPDGWTSDNDVVLLKRILALGLTDEVLNTDMFGDQSLPKLGAFATVGIRLSKGALQIRANQLARVLHTEDETGSSYRVLEERGNEFAILEASSTSPKAGTTNSSGTTDDPRVSMVTMSTSNGRARDELEDDDEVQVVAPPRQSHNSSLGFKSSGPAIDYDDDEVQVVEPPEPRVSQCSDIVYSPVKQEKRKSSGSEESSPEKKLRVT